jgi:DNA-binding GntR family transcriptional regulator
MAIDPRTGERVYAAIKQWILAGDLRLRQRLDIDTLAERLSASATPVRQALAILSAERLVTVHPSRGYYVAFWSERDLKTLYEWRWQLARVAIESFTAGPPEPRLKGSFLDLYLGLMRRIERNANEEVKRASRNADERLHAAYLAEAEVFPDPMKDIEKLSGVIARGDRTTVQRAARAYYRARINAVPAVRARAGIAALPRNGDD